MTKHLTDGQLRAALDGELDGELDRETAFHLDTCSICQGRQVVIQSQIQPAARGLSFLIDKPLPSAK